MLYQMIKKDLLLFWRRPRELITLLLMPFVLIAILGTALGAINGDRTPDLDIKMGIILNDNQAQAEKNMITFINGSKLPEDSKTEAIAGINRFNPVRILLDEVLASKEMKKNIHVTMIKKELTQKEKNKYDGILEIPKDFTEEFYQHAFFQNGKAPKFNLQLNQSNSFEAGIIRDMMMSFQEEISHWSVVHSLGLDGKELQGKVSGKVGGLSTVADKKPIDSVTYYAIGMSVMFIFYVASSASTLAFEQKENQIFGRVVLANVPAFIFFAGVFVSSMIMAFLQMNILFGLSALIFHVEWPNIGNYLMVTFLLCMMIGGFAVFISAISYRVNLESTSRLFSSFLVPILAFVGGSFFPVSQLGGVMETISNYSPGGAGMAAYFKVIQGYPISQITGQMITILIVTVVLIAIAVIIHPKRGEAV